MIKSFSLGCCLLHGPDHSVVAADEYLLEMAIMCDTTDVSASPSVLEYLIENECSYMCGLWPCMDCGLYDADQGYAKGPRGYWMRTSYMVPMFMGLQFTLGTPVFFSCVGATQMPGIYGSLFCRRSTCDGAIACTAVCDDHVMRLLKTL